MTHSLNEVEALAKKAARGAGLSWGEADEAGKAVRWLCGWGCDGVGILARWLGSSERELDNAPLSVSDPVWRAPSGRLDPFQCGAMLSDFAHRLPEQRRIELAGLSFPLLIFPFVARSAQHIRQPVSVSWGAVSMVSDGHGVTLSDDAGLLADSCDIAVVSLDCAMGAPAATVTRAHPAADDLAVLEVFAHRTYAPATEESRRLGAG